MIAISHKAKQFFLVTVKLLIVSGAIYYIYWHFNDDKKIDFNQINGYLSFKTLLILIAFSCVNWVLEIYKWKHLVSSFKEISFLNAMEQSLGSLTASIFTPNRIGEYGAKALYFSKKNTKQIVLLNFIGNSSQMLITAVFGFIGFSLIGFSLFQFYSIWMIFGFITLGILVIYLFRNIEIYGFSIKKLVQKIGSFSNRFHLKNLLFSTFRYLVFSFQFFFLLLIFDIDLEIEIALGTIFTMYFLASIIPTIHFMDVAIKGSVALFLFSQLGIEDWKIAAIISIMWFFNLLLPLLVGSVFVLNYKPLRK
jgi:hypothetical protein